MSEKVVKRFADSKVNPSGEPRECTHWIEYTDGTRETANEEAIMKLWNHWVVDAHALKYHENGFTVFEYQNR